MSEEETEPNIVPEVQEVESVVNTDLQERVKVLEERLEKLILFIKTGNSMPESYII